MENAAFNAVMPFGLDRTPATRRPTPVGGHSDPRAQQSGLSVGNASATSRPDGLTAFFRCYLDKPKDS
ncbi:MAG: hypothetical protein KME26_20120 [Oscillatoria princeps RMCB-10]|nr:hypothetical protein [Oscillatoria princeps RMCB-10]